MFALGGSLLPLLIRKQPNDVPTNGPNETSDESKDLRETTKTNSPTLLESVKKSAIDSFAVAKTKRMLLNPFLEGGYFRPR
mgnify:CR=1 FL=1